MPPPERVAHSRGASAPGRFAVAYGALLPALVDVVSANVEGPLPLGVRAWHAVYDVGLFVALGLMIDLATLGLRAAVRRRRVPFFAGYVAVGAALGYGLLERNFARQADLAFDGRYAVPIVVGLSVTAGLGVALCHIVGTFLAGRRWLFVVPPVLAAAGSVANVYFFRDDYLEAHTAVGACAAIFGGAATRRAASALLHRTRFVAASRRAAHAGAFGAIVTLVVSPANEVRLAFSRSPGCSGAWLAALHLWSLPPVPDGPQAVAERWLQRRSGTRPPSAARLTEGPPVVVLVTIDAVRADVVLDPERSAAWPTLSRLKREGATFTAARSPGSQTSVSLTTVFAGKYFSEMRWGRHGVGKSRFEYAAEDTSPRLAGLLSDAGIATFKVVSLMFLKNEFGVAGGFAEEVMVTEGRRHARAAEVLAPLYARLRKARGQPLFAFVHLTEPHAPYDRGKLKKGPAFDCYLSEIAEVDEHLARLVAALSTPDLQRRAILIVSSDHGEAFGEHGTFTHTKTIYEELVRVPLLVWGAGVQARVIDEPVSVADVFPTVLDLFGLEVSDDLTPVSLVPLLAGSDARLERPILAEGRLRRALYAGDLKVIVDTRKKTIEAYDLAADPGELDNVYTRDPARVEPALRSLEAFFAARGFSEGGYEPPYKP